MMTLRERLFPSNPENPHPLVKTEFVGSWESQFLGLGRLTRFLAEQLPRFSAADDDLGLGVIFLQRHHVEVGLKLLLERVGAGLETGHQLPKLFDACAAAFAASERRVDWEKFSNEQDEYIALLNEVDPWGFAYRYPVDTADQAVARPQFIVLAAVAEAGTAFEQSAMALVDVLARDELLEVDEGDIEDAVQEVAAAVRALRSVDAFLTAAKPAVSDHGRRLGLRESPLTADIEAARAKADTHAALAERLEPALQRVLDQLASRGRLAAPGLDLAPIAVSARPSARPGTPAEMAASMRALEKWWATGMGQTLRELKCSLRPVHARSAAWTGPAGRQLHNDIGRILSRM